MRKIFFIMLAGAISLAAWSYYPWIKALWSPEQHLYNLLKSRYWNVALLNKPNLILFIEQDLNFLEIKGPEMLVAISDINSHYDTLGEAQKSLYLAEWQKSFQDIRHKFDTLKGQSMFRSIAPEETDELRLLQSQMGRFQEIAAFATLEPDLFDWENAPPVVVRPE